MAEQKAFHGTTLAPAERFGLWNPAVDTYCNSRQKLLSFLPQMGVSEPLIQASLLGEAVEHGPAAVFVADENGRYVAVNQAACALVGYSREELLSMRVTDIADVDDGKWTEMRETGKVSGTALLACRNGSTVSFDYVAGATIVAGMPVYVSVGIAR
jgi:PAS domain S-box-containing protein